MPTIAAAPFPYAFPEHGVALIIIDMQHDFLEPGGFGEALGNHVAPLAAIVPTVRRLLDGFRAHGLPVGHPYQRSPSSGSLRLPACQTPSRAASAAYR